VRNNCAPRRGTADCTDCRLLLRHSVGLRIWGLWNVDQCAPGRQIRLRGMRRQQAGSLHSMCSGKHQAAAGLAGWPTAPGACTHPHCWTCVPAGH
jgi:hypothetical protein